MAFKTDATPDAPPLEPSRSVIDGADSRTVMPQDTLEFLNALRGGQAGFLEISYIHWDKEAAISPRIRYPAAPSAMNWAEVRQMSEEGRHAYFGVGTRRYPAGGKECVDTIGALWADLDGKRYDPVDVEKGKALALQALKEKLPPELQPSIIVDSGWGYHPYWLLFEPLDVSALASREQAESIMKGLAQLLGGDNVHDISRILRIPGSVNIKHLKEPALKKPMPCAIVFHDYKRRYSIMAFEHLAVRAALNERPPLASTPPELSHVNLDDLRISTGMKELIQAGSTPERVYASRSEAAQAVITTLVIGGHSDEEIAAVFANPDWAIGERSRERDGQRYLSISIAKGRAFVGERTSREEPASEPPRSDTPVGEPSGTIPPTPPPKKFSRPLSELFRGDVQKREYIAEPLIAVLSVGFVAGPPKQLKSMSMLEAARSIASGTPVFGRFAVSKPRRVLLVEEEDDETTLLTRMELLCRGAGVPPPKDEFFRYSVRPGLFIDVVADKVDLQFEALKKDVADFKPELLIIDALNRIHNGDENSQQQMSRLVHKLNELRDLGCAVIVIHHFNKFSKEKSRQGNQRLRGSSVLGGWAENSLYFMARDREDVLRIEPESKFAQCGPFAIRLDQVDKGNKDAGIRFSYIGDPSNQGKVETRERIYEVLEKFHLDNEAECTVKGLATSLDLSEGTVRNRLDELEKAGRVGFNLKQLEGKGQKQKVYFAKPIQAESVEVGE